MNGGNAFSHLAAKTAPAATERQPEGLCPLRRRKLRASTAERDRKAARRAVPVATQEATGIDSRARSKGGHGGCSHQRTREPYEHHQQGEALSLFPTGSKSGKRFLPYGRCAGILPLTTAPPLSRRQHDVPLRYAMHMRRKKKASVSSGETEACRTRNVAATCRRKAPFRWRT